MKNIPQFKAYHNEPEPLPKCQFCDHPYLIDMYYTWGDRWEWWCPIQHKLVINTSPCAYFTLRIERATKNA